MPLREQVEFEPMADEILVTAVTHEQVEHEFARHRDGETYIRAMKHGHAAGYLWQFCCATGERAKQWHEGQARRNVSK